MKGKNLGLGCINTEVGQMIQNVPGLLQESMACSLDRPK